jgi:hypothetical protein
VRFLDV